MVYEVWAYFPLYSKPTDSLKEKIAPKLTKKAQFMRNLLSSIYMILPKFVVTCDIDQMVLYYFVEVSTM